MRRGRKILSLILALTLLMGIAVQSGVSAFAEGVSDSVIVNLQTDYTTNPIGSDASTPTFSWQMQSEARGQLQSAYQVMVSSSAEKLAAGDYDMWDSGKIESGIAVGVAYEGKALQAATRYFWQVKVWDQDGDAAISTEEAYFETGLMDSGWDNAKWIMVNNDAEEEEGSSLNTFSIEMDMIIDSDNAGICFGAADKSSFFMWQISTLEGKDDDAVLVRPHVKKNGNWVQYPGLNGGTAYDVTNAIGYKASELIGKEIHVKIVIKDGKTIDTYFNGSATSAFTYSIPTNLTGNFTLGKLMFRHQTDKGCAEIARYDNFIVRDGEENVLFEETFDDPADTGFDGGEVVDGWLKIGVAQTGNVNQESLVIQTRENKDYSGVDKSAFTMDFDVVIDKDNAGICFGASDTNNYYMWQINAHNSISAELSETTGCADESAGYTYNHVYTRPHIRSGGSWALTPNESVISDITQAMIDAGYPEADWTAKGIIGKQFHVQFEVGSGTIKTYIVVGEDKVLVATNTYTGSLAGDKIMFRHTYDKNAQEIARYDNFVVKNYQGKVTFEDDFSNASNPNFTGGTVVDGMLKVGGDSSVAEALYIQKDPQSGTSAPMFRKEFTTSSDIASAKLYASAAGIYEVYLNGSKVGDDYFNPGWTDYMKNTMYQTFDVTDMVVANGANAIGAMLGEGWYSGNIAHVGGDRFGKDLAFIAKLVITYADGTQSTIVTDDSWTVSTNGPITDNNFLNGEKYDSRLEKDGWDTAGYAADNSWRKVKTTDSVQNIGELIAQIGPTVTQVDTLKPVSVNKVTRADGEEVFIYDFGQNFAGVVSLTNLKGEAGTTISLRHGEMLNDAPKGTRGCDDNEGTLYDANLRTFKAIDTYTLKGDANGETYTPRFTFHGFRYLEISGITEAIPVEDVTGIVLSSDADWASSYETSNELVNKLYSNVLWGQRSNFLSIPTDCPQRNERMGWTGDAQIFARTATYNMNADQFYKKYLNDIRTSQRSDGCVSAVAPALNVYESYDGNGWGDAVVIIPWQMYQQYNDTTFITDNYDAMKAWIDYNKKNSNNFLRPDGFYGDWLSINSSTPTGLTNTAWFAYVSELFSKMAAVIGEDQDAAAYAQLAENIKEAWRARYIQDDGSLTADTQTAYLVALGFDLVLPDQRANLARLLVENIKEHGYHLTVGFVGVSYLCPVLSEMGYDDVAYKLLEQETYPGWLYSVLQGATTIWERWNSYTLESGFGDVSMNSFNHYSYGSIEEWMMRYSLGIERDEEQPGYKHIILQPTFGGTLTYAKGHYDSVYGRISSGWALDGEDFTYDVTIPANTTATLYLPAEADVYESGKPIAEAEGVQVTGEKDGKVIMELGSGTYSFSTKVDPTVKERYSLAIANPYSVDATATINGETYSVPNSILATEGQKEITIASNDPNYAFAYWGKDIFDTNPSKTVDLTGDTALTAYFKYVATAQEGAETATLNLTGEEGTVIQVNGEEVTLPYSGSFAIGTEVTIDVKAPANKFFDGWEGDQLLGNHAVVVMNGDVTASPVFSGFVANTNIALKKSVTSNDGVTIGSDWANSKLTDGTVKGSGFTSNTNTGVDTSANPKWFEIDLGKNELIDRVVLYPRTDAGSYQYNAHYFPQDFTISVCKDGETEYTVVKTVTGHADTDQPVTLDFDTTTARYVRLTATKLSAAQTTGDIPRLQMAEMEIYNTNEEAPPAVDTIDISAEKNSVNVGETLDLSAVVNPSDAVQKDISWVIHNPDGSLSDKATLTIDGSTATLTALKEGIVDVVAVANDGRGGLGKIRIFIGETPEINVTVKATNDADEEITSAAKGEMFTVTITTPIDVKDARLLNEYGMPVGRKNLVVTNNDEGGKTWTFQTSIGTVGNGRTMTVVTQDSKGVYSETDAVLTMDIKSPAPVVISASIEETAVANAPVALTVVTDTNVNKIKVYNEFGASMGVLSSSYQDVDGQRVWTVYIKIGTRGERTMYVAGQDKYGVISEKVATNSVTVKPF